MTLQSLRNMAPGMAGLMRLPLSELALCADCGGFYRATERFWCSQSQGMESFDGSCGTEECQDARGGLLYTQSGIVTVSNVGAAPVPHKVLGGDTAMSTLSGEQPFPELFGGIE